MSLTHRAWALLALVNYGAAYERIAEAQSVEWNVPLLGVYRESQLGHGRINPAQLKNEARLVCLATPNKPVDNGADYCRSNARVVNVETLSEPRARFFKVRGTNDHADVHFGGSRIWKDRQSHSYSCKERPAPFRFVESPLFGDWIGQANVRENERANVNVRGRRSTDIPERKSQRYAPPFRRPRPAADELNVGRYPRPLLSVELTGQMLKGGLASPPERSCKGGDCNGGKAGNDSAEIRKELREVERTYREGVVVGAVFILGILWYLTYLAMRYDKQHYGADDH
jgi:hypothetical protein